VPALDRVEIAEEHVDRRAAECEPRAAVHDRPPFTELGHETFVTEAAQVGGLQHAAGRAVVEPEIPVAVGPMRRDGARAAERHGERARQLGQLCGERGDVRGEVNHRPRGQ
jgi:hypothetical protein